jgi:hypothetical protein
MLCSDTGETKSIHIEGMSVRDTKLIGKALRSVRKQEHGNGDICIPLINGLLKRIRVMTDMYHDDDKK